MALYSLAENLSMTVHELLHGEKAPLSNDEFFHWIAFNKIRAEKQKEQQQKSSNTQSSRPRTLGGNA